MPAERCLSTPAVVRARVAPALPAQPGRTVAPSRANLHPRARPADATPNRAATSAPADAPHSVQVPYSGAGRFRLAAGPARAPRTGDIRYRVQVERGVPVDPAQVAAKVEAALGDPRSWAGPGRMRFVRVGSGHVDLSILIATPRTTDRLCLPMITHGQLSCRRGDRAIINARRWVFGVPAYAGDVSAYRSYVVNHEVGHFLGHGHVLCPKPGWRAPVMVQQTKGLRGCRANPWPFPRVSG